MAAQECLTIHERLPLAEWAGRFMVLGAIWRAYQPGEKLDEMPVLIGRGGIGKSTCTRFLLPADRGEWFSDGLHLAADSKVRAEALTGQSRGRSCGDAGLYPRRPGNL